MTALSMKNVNKSYKIINGKIQILKNFSLEIHSGSTTALWGASGSGKTTFLNILGSFDTPDEGEVSLGEKFIPSLKGKELSEYRRKDIAVIWQENNLITELTALENISIGLDGQSNSNNAFLLEKYAHRLGVFELLDKFPGQLSGGERQRISILRAMIKRPKMILADEPTANLDWKNALEVFSIFLELVKELNCILIVATHDKRIAKMCDKIINLQSESEYTSSLDK